jgi:hypothetical protein
VASIAFNRVLLRDGVAVATLEAGEVESLEAGTDSPDDTLHRALRLGSMPAGLRPYYA